MNYSFVMYFAGSVRGDDFLTVHGLYNGLRAKGTRLK